MNDKSVELILHAGNATYYASLAVDAAREYNFELANQNMKMAEEEEQIAHKVQTDLLVGLANGVDSIPDILMVHAQDHVTSGTLNIRMSKELIFLYQKLSSLEKGERK